MTTATFLSDPHAILHIPRCVAIARNAMAGMKPATARKILPLIDAAESADYTWYSGPSYRVDEAAFDANVARVNATGTALLKAVGCEYT